MRLRTSAAAFAALAVSTGLAACNPTPTPPTPFVVNSVGDQPDQATDNRCRTAAGTCTLRAAMQEAESQSGRQQIHFAIPGTGVHRISVATALPLLFDGAGVVIDGYTEPGSRVNAATHGSDAVLNIEVQGPGLGTNGLVMHSPNNVVKGVAVFGFGLNISMYGDNAHHNEVTGSFVGTDATGTIGAATYGGGGFGVHLQRGAHDNVIGKPGLEHRNVVSGNPQHGIALYDGFTQYNRIQNNVVGLRPDGSAALPNRSHGIDINTAAGHNLIGGDAAGERNVVSGNADVGIEISHSFFTQYNDIIGNLIGTSLDGTSAPPFARNTWGIFLEGHGVCGAECPEDQGLSTVRGNVIVNSAVGGITIHKGSRLNVVEQNWIGVLADGTPAPNLEWGVRIEKGAVGNRIGPGNVIAHNGSGIQLRPTGGFPTSPEEVPTDRNTFTRNRTFANTSFGIDLAPWGAATPTPTAVVNEGSAVPTVQLATSETVLMTTCGQCTVELFLADGPEGADGEGEEHLLSAVADPAGLVTIPVDDRFRGRVVTATSTNVTGSTSEFAANFVVPATVLP